MRIVLNANLGYVVGKVLTDAGHTVLYASLELPGGADDPAVSRWAIEHECHLVTSDRGFRREMEAAGVDFPNALVTLSTSELASASTYAQLMHRLLEVHPQWQAKTHYLVSPGGIRVRKL